MNTDLGYDESLRAPEANRRSYFVVILVVGVLAAVTGPAVRAGPDAPGGGSIAG